MKIYLAVLLFIASLLAPEHSSAAPKASKSEYLKTTAAGINISGGKEPLFYSLTVSLRKKLDKPLYVRSFFERPGDPDNPLVAESEIQPQDSSVFIESPLFQGIDNDKTYSVIVVLFQDEEREKEISRHEQGVHFSVPSKFFTKLGLKKP